MAYRGRQREGMTVTQPSNPDTNQPLLLMTQEAAARLTVSYEWLKKKAQVNAVPCVRFGRNVRFTEADVQAIVEMFHSNRRVRADRRDEGRGRGRRSTL